MEGRAAAALVVLFCVAPAAWSDNDRPGRARPILCLAGEYAHHGYRTDEGGRFRFGAPSVDFRIGGEIVTYKGGGSSPSGYLAAYTHSVETPQIPESVRTRAEQRGIPVDRVSLRLQSFWGVAVSVFASPDLRVGYRYRSESWRYDSLAKPAGTTIPYIKGEQSSQALLIVHTSRAGKLRLRAGAFIGRASVSFRDGEERYLSDNDEATITSGSGDVWGYTLAVAPDGERRIRPFAGLEGSFTSAAGVKVNSTCVLLGVEADF
jgi:hypothetical protein